MMKTIIIEDEINTREALKKMLNLVAPSVHIIAETGFIKEAIPLLKSKKPDLVFMDIELEDGTGFELLEQLNTIDFKIIFTTAYNQYAINAFKYSATDYLLKPIDSTELKNAIDRAENEIKQKIEHEELVTVLKNNLNNESKKIVLKTTEQRYIINIEDIIRLEADTAYTIFYTASRKITISKHLKYYQDLLGTHFIRCHQSHLVNKKHIKGIHKNESLRMSNEDLIPISIRKKKEILAHIYNL